MQWLASVLNISQVLLLWAGSLLPGFNNPTKCRASLSPPSPCHFWKWPSVGTGWATAKLLYTLCNEIFFTFYKPCLRKHACTVITESGMPLMPNKNFLPNKTAQWVAIVYLAFNWSMASKNSYLLFSLHHPPSFPDVLLYLPLLLCSLSSHFFWSLCWLIRETALRGTMALSYALQLCKFALTFRQPRFLPACNRSQWAGEGEIVCITQPRQRTSMCLVPQWEALCGLTWWLEQL